MRITTAESHVLEALWKGPPLTVDEIIAEVAEPQRWGSATVKTLINRLQKKKAVSSERIDGRIRYRALVDRADYLQAESQDLLDRLFDGRLTALVAHFAESRKLSPEELERLKMLIGTLDVD